MTSEVSVIIPNYNCKLYLTKCLNSVLAQRGVNMELVIIDDGSTDGSREWLQKVAHTFPYVNLVCQKNQGVINARNSAIKMAKAPFIAFLDADDSWRPDKLQKQVAFMKKYPNCGLTFSNYDHIDMQGNSIVDCFSFYTEYKKFLPNAKQYELLQNPASILLETNLIGTSSVLARKSTLVKAGGFNPKLRSASDWDCWLRIALISEVGFTSEITMDYLMRPQSITSNRQARLDAMSAIIDKYGQHPNIAKASEQKARARLHDSYREMYLEQGIGFKAIWHASAACWQFPHRRHWRHLLACSKNLLLNPKQLVSV